MSTGISRHTQTTILVSAQWSWSKYKDGQGLGFFVGAKTTHSGDQLIQISCIFYMYQYKKTNTIQ